MARFIFITGGVVSSLGKGLMAASLAALLQARGYRVRIRKFDPYLNVDPGTMSPYQHGEVYVTDDGAETDLDLGHYERFTGVAARQSDNVTSGRIYQQIIQRERRGDYLGATVQVIPHVTDAIKQFALADTEDLDFVLCEIGGTVGDIEGLPFVEAIRQMRNELGYDGVIITDGIDMGAISARYGVAEGTVKAVVAGCDALCWGGSPGDEDAYLYLRNALVWAVREGRLSAERLHEAAERNRAAARWSRTVRTATAGAKADRAVGLEAARRALVVRSEVKPLTSAPYVAEFSPVVSLAVDNATPWGLAKPLAELLPGTTVEQIPAPTKGLETIGLMVAPVVDQDARIDLAPLLERATARPLLLCVRDLHRNPWMRRAVEAAKAARPDAVVVEFGLPHGELADVLTHGGSRVSGQAAAELLTGRKSEH